MHTIMSQKKFIYNKKIYFKKFSKFIKYLIVKNRCMYILISLIKKSITKIHVRESIRSHTLLIMSKYQLIPVFSSFFTYHFKNSKLLDLFQQTSKCLPLYINFTLLIQFNYRGIRILQKWTMQSIQSIGN